MIASRIRCNSQSVNNAAIWLAVTSFLLIPVGWIEARGHATTTSESSPHKVLLRWKFTPEDVFQGKLAFTIHTLNEHPQKTSFIYEYEWTVLSRRSDGHAEVKSIVNRERFQHRSDKVNVDYDSNDDSSFKPTEGDLSEIGPFLQMVRNLHKHDYRYVFSDRGEAWSATKHETYPELLIRWPELPEQPVGVGDSWRGVSRHRQDEEFTLVKLDTLDGHTVAWIERKSDTMRCRFLVDEGRFLDDVFWNIARIERKQGGDYLQSTSQRRRLELSRYHEPLDRWRALQPNQKGRAMHMLSQSLAQTDKIDEHLLDEKSYLSRIQNGLFIEHVETMNFGAASPNWNPIDWLLTARYAERSGEIAQYREFLKRGVESAIAISDKGDLMRNIFLLNFAELLAGAGEFETARKACLEISPKAFSGAAFTDRGVISVSDSALSNYGLFILAAEQARAGFADEATSTAQSITQPSSRSAAHWVIAMHFADQGKSSLANQSVASAERLFSTSGKTFEFDATGPTEVPVHVYRTLALVKIAICQARQGDDASMRKTIAMIMDPTERNAALVDIALTLCKAGMEPLVNTLTPDLPESSRNTVIRNRLAMHLRAQEWPIVDKLIEDTSDPAVKVDFRMDYCMALRPYADHAAELQKQLDLMQVAIQGISEPLSHASSTINYATVLLSTGKTAEARTQLLAAAKHIESSPLQDAARFEMLLGIAKLMARADTTDQFEVLMSKLDAIASRQEESQKASYRLSMMDAYLERNAMQESEGIADQIEDASLRCVALARIGVRYAQLLELEPSRRVFRTGFESAMKVVDASGLDTVYSKGGAIRFMAQQQGECDLEGLIGFLEHTTNPNLLAYGYIGGLEAFDPDAAKAAARTGRIPDTILNVVCEDSIACQLLRASPPPPNAILEDQSKERE